MPSPGTHGRAAPPAAMLPAHSMSLPRRRRRALTNNVGSSYGVSHHRADAAADSSAVVAAQVRWRSGCCESFNQPSPSGSMHACSIRGVSQAIAPDRALPRYRPPMLLGVGRWGPGPTWAAEALSSLKGWVFVNRLLTSGFAGFRPPCRQHWVRAGGQDGAPAALARTNGLDAGPARCMLSAMPEDQRRDCVVVGSFSMLRWADTWLFRLGRGLV